MKRATTLLMALACAACARDPGPPAVSGTAAVTAESCRATDWRAIGYQDGATGAPFESYAIRAGACERAGVAADRLQYSAGRLEGLRSYCSFEGGYRAGASGVEYAGVCPIELSPAFERGYAQGLASRAPRTVPVRPTIGVGVSGGSGGGFGIGTGIGIGF